MIRFVVSIIYVCVFAQVIKYPRAGHLIEPPFVPFCEESYHKMAMGAMMWGGKDIDHCNAQVDSWQRIISFFKDRLTPSPASKL